MEETKDVDLQDKRLNDPLAVILDQWKSVYYVARKTPPPSTPPTLQEMVRMVAQLGGYIKRMGGYIKRKRPDEPGPQTVWLGLQRTHDIANCWLVPCQALMLGLNEMVRGSLAAPDTPCQPAN